MTHKKVASFVWELALLTSPWLGASLKTAPNSRNSPPALDAHVKDVPRLVGRATSKLAEEMTALLPIDHRAQDAREATLGSSVPGAAVQTSVGQALLRLQKSLKDEGASIVKWTESGEEGLERGLNSVEIFGYRTQNEKIAQSQRSLEAFRNASRERQRPLQSKIANLELEISELAKRVEGEMQRLDSIKRAARMRERLSASSSNVSSHRVNATRAVSVKASKVQLPPNGSHIQPQGLKKKATRINSAATKVPAKALQATPTAFQAAAEAYLGENSLDYMHKATRINGAATKVPAKGLQVAPMAFQAAEKLRGKHLHTTPGAARNKAEKQRAPARSKAKLPKVVTGPPRQPTPPPLPVQIPLPPLPPIGDQFLPTLAPEAKRTVISATVNAAAEETSAILDAAGAPLYHAKAASAPYVPAAPVSDSLLTPKGTPALDRHYTSPDDLEVLEESMQRLQVDLQKLAEPMPAEVDNMLNHGLKGSHKLVKGLPLTTASPALGGNSSSDGSATWKLKPPSLNLSKNLQNWLVHGRGQ